MPAIGFERIGVGTCVGRGAATFVKNWPKWVAFSFVYGITFGTVVSQAATKFHSSCILTADDRLVCDNWWLVAVIVGLLVGGVAGFITVCAVWTQRRPEARPRWLATFAAALPVGVLSIVGTLAAVAVGQHFLGTTTLSTVHERTGLVVSAVAASGVGSLIAVMPVAFTPIAVADGRTFRFGVKFFRTHRAATVQLVLVTLVLVCAAVALARIAVYVVPLFALIVPMVVLMWMEAYWQGMEAIDAFEMAHIANVDEFADLDEGLGGPIAVGSQEPMDPAGDASTPDGE